jgi:tetratricopeptide (TPR) repeat protein
MTLDPRGFPGTERFRIARCLGSGGMGVVYEALDRDRNEVVALKTLRWTDPSAIYRLKREFRTLVGLVHPNLVALYELFGDADEWYFTMELVKGRRFLEFVRPDGLAVERLRAALAQLATGLVALHRAGKLHRDLKPSNVLVTAEGRPVILDFGIAADTTPGDPLRTTEEGIWGTAEYMSPEQGRGEASEASDWYAMGCMLYEALTGQLPFLGLPLRVLSEKAQQDPPDPGRVVPGLPADLVALCRDLMARLPERRPRYGEILERLGAPVPARGVATGGAPSAGGAALIGRDAQLAELERAFGLAQRGRAVLVLVRGPSGIGKTALVRRFVEQLAAENRAVVLSGRCYVRESMPYKGLDGVIDSLTHFLRTLPEPDLDRLITPDLATVLALFPVLGRVPRLLQLPAPERDVVDPVALRHRRFSALQGLFRRIAAARPVVAHIDDLQWGDADSIMLLDALLGPPDPPALLVIASFSSEDPDSPQPFLRTLLGRAGTERCRELVLSPLSDADARRLAQSLLEAERRSGRGSGGVRRSGATAVREQDAADGDDGVDAIVREAAGNPFLVEQLVHYLALLVPAAAAGATSKVSLGDVLEARLAQLPGGARALLETLALAGQPLDAAVAHDVAGLREGEDARPVVALLQAERWLKDTRSGERLELYHDGIRRALLARIAPARVSPMHLSLATAMEARRAGDPETLYEHYLEAGERARALSCATQAAAKAARALAFERAALFCRRALALAPEGGTEAAALYAQLGEALASAGRVRDAAEAYSRAAALSGPSDALELRRLAAEQFLIGGRIQEGLALLKSVLDATGLGLPKSRGRAVASLLWHRARLRLRGLHFVERPAAAIPAAQLARIDVCRTVAEGLGHLDTIRAADFQTRHLLLALRAGEPDRLARAFALEGGFTAALGGRSRWYDRLLAEAEGLGRRIQSPHALGLRAVMGGVAAYFAGEFERARDATQQAEGLLLEHGVGIAWELVTARFYHTVSLYYLGEVEEFSRCAAAYVKDAAERGNRFAALMFRSGPTNAAWLFADDVAGARGALAEALAEWPTHPFGSPHYMAMTAHGRIELYAGTPENGWAAIERSWRALSRTGLFRIQSVRTAARQIRASCGLGASRTGRRGASGGGRTAALLAAAERDAAAIAAERAPYCAPTAALLTAAVAAGRGDEAGAVRALRAALEGFEACHMKLFLAVARRRLGELLAGDEGRALVDQANAWMTAHGIVNADRTTATLAPGFPG